MRAYLAFFAGILVLLSMPAQARVEARDVRTQVRSRWDYQPGQGPRSLRSRDFALGFSEDTAIPPLPPLEKDDWRDPPRAQDIAVADSLAKEDLRTRTTVNAGLQVSSYLYREKDANMKLLGPDFGVTFSATRAFENDWFARVDGRLAAANLDYEGSGEADDNANIIGEARLTFGYDFAGENFAISPYAGIGYRYLFNDLRGTTSSGASGYRRESQYLYAPIGLQPRFSLPNGARLVFSLEYDHLIRGWQTSRFSDYLSTWPDIRNEQKNGYGARGEAMVERDEWALGPFVQYWNIGRSGTECKQGSGVYVCSYEPRNRTIELGIQLLYRFY